MKAERVGEHLLEVAVRLAKWGAILGVVCGLLYSVGGFFVDLFTTGLNRGTALAFGALVGMPAILGVVGFLLGVFLGLTIQVVQAVRRCGAR